MKVQRHALKAIVAAAGLAGLMAPTASHAVVAVSQGFSFFGTCSDCTLLSPPGAPIATLELVAGYVLGTPISPGDIISFSYVGSNLVFPYSLTGPAGLANPNDFSLIYGAGGSMTGTPGPQDFHVDFIDGLRFESTAAGTWFTCAVGPNGFYSGTCSQLVNTDFGNGVWNAPAIPEPGTWGLMALGLAGVALRRRLG